MKKFNSRKDYYAVLGLTSDATNEVIGKSYRKLALIWHPDKWAKDKKYPPRDAPKTEEAVKNRFQVINEANEAISDPVTRAEYDYHRAVYKEIIKAYKIVADYDASPVEEASRRKSEGPYRRPTTEEEFFQCLEEDEKRHRKCVFRYANAQPLRVKQNIWKLIQAKRLSYEDLEKGEDIQHSFLWHAVFNDDEVTDYVCEGLGLTESRIRRLKERDAKSGSNKDSVEEELRKINIVAMANDYWTQCKNPDSSLPEKFEALGLGLPSSDDEAAHAVVHRERFLLFILNDGRTVDDHSIHLSSRNGNKLAACELTQIVNKWMGNLIRNYRTQKKKLSFAQLRQQLGYLEDVFFLDLSNVLTLLGDRLFAPMAVKILELTNKKDTVSQIKVIQLNNVLKKIQEKIAEELTSWVESTQPGDLGVRHSDEYNTKFREIHAPKVVNIFREVFKIIKQYEQKKEIVKNANMLGAILKFLKCAVQATLTIGIAAVVSQRVRDGLFFRPNTQVVLRTCGKELLEEQKKITPKGPSLTA
ncbi:chaperone protein (plasmid) [Coxiella burnetii]|uniref:Chaperone protein n=1 Tax=Coxiella burnetii (strain Dugway 5J108-111) TaxID=434922 RepID=A9KH46_COXBN|nr:J domain-containing protein [Coxiella burnetii]ABS78553.1 chaperone protein [Coxiella burnetii Dugway 5J108-111]OYK79190.1 chaperone protein [Coxiella burnetii]OYK81229.1 chaperone protein [Coxiella burnetii]